MTERPRVQNAPGLVWRKRAEGHEARWQARTDLIKRGWEPKSVHLWKGVEPTELQWKWIVDRCRALQAEMLLWGKGGIQETPLFDGTMGALIRGYQSDLDSPYRKLRYKSRLHYADLLKRIDKDHGSELIREVRTRTVLRWYEDWSAGGKIAMGHAMITMLRTVLSFGASILEDEDCGRLFGLLAKQKFQQAPPRNERLTAEQATAIRVAAHAAGHHSIALAQAIQFECILRQKDVIGEWMPMSEPVPSVVHFGHRKWARGIRWSEIDEHLILTHITSKRNKEIVVDLKLAPMVMEELAKLGPRPSSGPVIVREATGRPWEADDFRRCWRELATACGIPRHVRNMDSRAGAISEATDAGADIEKVRHAATHSDISMTQRYSRGGTEKTAEVMRLRTEHRNKTGT